ESASVLQRGSVTLVGAGPGSPGLLTMQALRALQNADVILYDRLVSRQILALARRDAEKIPVGKTPGGPSTPQPVINEQMISLAAAGKRVVRLKGGDPFVFGRGAEELDALRAAGVPFDVVPGITAATALALAGIPLTHRELASGVRLVSAQRAASAAALDWHSWARTDETLVVYMGVAQLETLCEELQRHGRDGATPVAIVERVSLPEQRVLVTTLAAASAAAEQHRIEAPALVVIGAVAARARDYHFFGAPPIDAAAPATTACAA
ncbi:MAG: uroporphyrinogen-III C-methyltransferase, partial [Steroidobacteraceae bacterium]|nr:uroporphyrinogen-III C-methyltransferase [Steroidobacteraceae bacterium]MDW8257894.1 uroporphyrinogen-III C-methyltransferase [Gammaproteobacteria bacterium]